MKTYAEIKKELKVDDEFFAKMFGYKDANSFRNSSRAHKIIIGIQKFYDHVKKQV